MIVCKCPGCDQKLRVMDLAAGKKILCPRCKMAVPVPRPVAPSGPETVGLPDSRPDLPARAANVARTEELSAEPPEPDATLAAPPESPATGLTFPAGDQGTDPRALLSPPQAPDEIGRLGGYRVLGVLGAGGMGAVFRAEDPQLERQVALKVMLPGQAGEVGRKRFLREARAAAALEHDNVVPIFQVGEDRGVPFIAMPFLHGEPLDVCLNREKRLPVLMTVRIGKQIALGLAAAHKRGLIHRDVKPGNVWLEEETRRVKILDFGLARSANALNAEEETASNAPASQAATVVAPALTQAGALVGTPAFMAPEQVAGEKVDEHCDLFALGCVLYQMAAGEQPFLRDDTMKTLEAVVTHQPPPPRKRNGSVPRALSKLILQLLAKKAEDRPASAADVARRLERIERSILDPRRVWPWVAASLLVLLVVAAVPATYFYLSGYFWSNPRLQTQLEPIDFDLPPVPTADDLAEMDSPADGLVRPDGLGDDLPAEVVAVLGGREWRVNAIPRFPAFSHDGKLVAVPSGNDVMLFDATTGKGRPLVGHIGRVLNAAFNHDGSQAASAGWDRTVKIWDTASGQMKYSWPLQGDPWSVAWSPDGTKVASGGNSGTITVWSAVGAMLYSKQAHGHVYELAFSPDSKTLVSSGVDSRLNVWNAADGKLRQTLSHPGLNLAALTFRADGRMLATGSDSSLKLWAVGEGPAAELTLMRTVETPAGGLAAFTDDGKTVLTLSHGNPTKEHRVALQFNRWEVDTGEARGDFNLPSRGTWACARLSPDGKTLTAIAEDDRFVNVCDARTGTWRSPRLGHSVQAHWVRFSPDGRTLASGGNDGRVVLWDVATGKQRISVQAYNGLATCLAFSPDSKILASGSNVHPEGIVLWDAADGRKIHHITGHTAAISDLAISPDGRMIASVSQDASLRLWEMKSGVQLHRLEHGAWVGGCAFSRDGRTLATGDVNGKCRLFDPFRGTEQQSWPGTHVNKLCYVPGGDELATVGNDGDLVVWDAATGKQTRRVPGAAAALNQLAVRPDGGMIAACGVDGAVRLYDLESVPVRRRAFLLAPHSVPLYAVAFSPDGRHLATATPDGAVLVLRLAKKGSVPRISEAEAGLSLVRNLENVPLKSHNALLSSDERHLLIRLPECLAVWDVQVDREVHRFVGHGDPVVAMALSPDGKQAVTAGQDRTVRSWDVASGKERWRTEAALPVMHLAVSRDGKTVAGASGLEATLWTRGGKLAGQFTTTLPVTSLAVAPDGARLLLGTTTGVVLCDREGKPIRRFTGQSRTVKAMVFSHDGGSVYSIGSDGAARRWQLSDGALVRRFAQGAVGAMSLTPDGTRLVTASATDRTLRVWDTDTGRELDRTLFGTTVPTLPCSDTHAVFADSKGTPALWRLPAAQKQ